MPADHTAPDQESAEHDDCEFCSPPLIPIAPPWDRPGAEDPATWGGVPQGEESIE